MTDRRVVITGLGVLTPVGNEVETFWSNLKNGVSGIHTIDAFDTAAYDCKILLATLPAVLWGTGAV